MPTANPNDDIGPLSLDDDAKPAAPADALGDYSDDDGLRRLRHASIGLGVVTVAMVTMVMCLAAMSLVGAINIGRPDYKSPWMIVWYVVFVIANVVSLLGKLKMRFDHEALAEPNFLDASLLAGVAPYVVWGSIFWLPFPGESAIASVLGIPISFLLFVRFLRSFSAQFDRPDLVRHAARLLKFSAVVLAVALFGFGLLWVQAALGMLCILGAYFAGAVSAYWYAQLLVALRRLV
jgi:hypothetical protein